MKLVDPEFWEANTLKADAVPLLDLFEKKMRLEVPLFQRQYVWTSEQQWGPLWEDVSRKFADFIAGRDDGPVHFLGAMVLDQKQTPATHVEKRQVIDGQQRLTTLQILLAVLRDFCGSREDCAELAGEFEKFTLNSGKMADPAVDRFKVWPTQADRPYFMDVMSLRSREAVETKYPLVRRKYQRKPDPRPRIVDAYLFFDGEVREFFLGNDEPPVMAEIPLEERVDAAFRALKGALHVVSIDLELGDDPQVIFETLNARGEPLLPADLLRNYIFLRAARSQESQEALYEEYWKGFDEDFWRTEVSQGRLKRPRSDLFMQHFLASRQAVDIPIKHLYVEYRYWIERTKPFPTVEAELRVLKEQGTHFRRLLEPEVDDPVFSLATFMERFDVRTAYPLMLHLEAAALTPDAWERISVTIESYLLRRAVVGWSTKAYNRIFLGLVKVLQKSEPERVPDLISARLADLTGESSAWPDDDVFSKAWMVREAYEHLNRARLRHILARLNDKYLSNKNEKLTIESELSVEHLMPQAWVENWPLPDGTRGVPWEEMGELPNDDPRVLASIARDRVIHTMGNLTILKQELNSAVSNGGWATKQPALMAASLLPLNLMLGEYSEWDDAAIGRRGEELLRHALDIWPGPRSVGK